MKFPKHFRRKKHHKQRTYFTHSSEKRFLYNSIIQTHSRIILKHRNTFAPISIREKKIEQSSAGSLRYRITPARSRTESAEANSATENSEEGNKTVQRRVASCSRFNNQFRVSARVQRRDGTLTRP